MEGFEYRHADASTGQVTPGRKLTSDRKLTPNVKLTADGTLTGTGCGTLGGAGRAGARILCMPRCNRKGLTLPHPTMRERIFIELMTSDRKVKASREGSK